MQEKYNNKMVTNAKNKSGEQEQEFHFAGGMEYLPQTVKAKSREEAEKHWEATRVKVDRPEVARPEPAEEI